MSRFTSIIPLDEFRKKCEDKFKFDSEDFCVYLAILEPLRSDLKKVLFDWENYNLGNADPSYAKYPQEGYIGYPVGYEVLPNGMPVLFVNAGGDWETPICFCIYWDGKKLRAYIPKDGNMWNKDKKCAYGSEDEENYWNGREEELQNFRGDADKIRLDVMARIQLR